MGEKPFVYQQFNVKCFTSRPACTTRSVPARLINILIKALNEAVKLPRFIIVVPDWDLVKFFNHSTFSIKKITREVLGWMMDSAMFAVEEKRNQLIKIKPGSVVSTEPKFIWVKMLQRMRAFNKTLTVRSKYNAVLEELLAEHSLHHVIDPNPILRDAAYFNKLNNLNSEGSILFWKEIDECIKMFESSRKLTLKPRKDPNKDDRSDSTAMLRFRLPPVPPAKDGHGARPPKPTVRQDYDFKNQSRHLQQSTRRRHDHLVHQTKPWSSKKFLSEY